MSAPATSPLEMVSKIRVALDALEAALMAGQGITFIFATKTKATEETYSVLEVLGNAGMKLPFEVAEQVCKQADTPMPLGMMLYKLGLLDPSGEDEGEETSEAEREPEEE